MRALDECKYIARNISAALCGLVMRRLPFRFSKDYRHEVTRFHAVIYALVNTVAANYVADGDDWRVAIFWGYPRQSRYH